MKKHPPNPIKVIAFVFFAIILTYSAFIGILLISYDETEITSLSEYGIITGNGDNEDPQAVFDAYFPSNPTQFENVTYIYRACNVDAIGCEAYLEFTITDQLEYEAYLDQLLLRGGRPIPFYFDADYLEYVLYDSIEITPTEDGREYYSIPSASIAKILIEPNEHQFIYVMLNVFDGGGSNTEILGNFFGRFNIDPIEYAEYTENVTANGIPEHWEWTDWAERK